MVPHPEEVSLPNMEPRPELQEALVVLQVDMEVLQEVLVAMEVLQEVMEVPVEVLEVPEAMEVPVEALEDTVIRMINQSPPITSSHTK